MLGLLLSVFVVRDTARHVQHEETKSRQAPLQNVFWATTWRNRNLSATTQAGLINNLNDGMIWGLLPLLLITHGIQQEEIGLITAVYPAVWGIGQLVTGRLADWYSNKKILFWGMLIQGLAILVLAMVKTVPIYIALSVFLGLGTALVYPTFFVVIARYAKPEQRAESIGVFRLWRDLGYALGALLSGLIADAFGLVYAVMVIGALTVMSAVVIQLRME